MGRSGIGIRGAAISLLSVFLACSSSHTEEDVGSTAQAVVDGSIARVLSFEQPITDWSATNLQLQQSNVFFDGAHSAAVSVVTSGGTLTSVPLSSFGAISSTATVQVRIPSYLAGQSWPGQLELQLNSPTAGIWNQTFGPVMLQNATSTAFQTIQFPLPPSVVSSLSNTSFTDLRVALRFEVGPNPNSASATSDPFYVDHFDFGQANSGSLGGVGAGGATGNAGTSSIGGSIGASASGAGGVAGSVSGSGGSNGTGATVGAGGGAGVSGASGPGPDSSGTCDGVQCCPIGLTSVVLTPNADVYTTTTSGLCIIGEDGSDTIQSSATGDTTILGGPGDDTIMAGTGNNNVIRGGAGRDTIFGSGAHDTILGNAGDDTIFGGNGNSVIVPGPGIDTVAAGTGDDTIEIFDLCEVGAGETLDGGGGNDTLVTPVSLDQLTALGVTVKNIERIIVQQNSCKSECVAQPDCNGNGACTEGPTTGIVQCQCDSGIAGTNCASNSCTPNCATKSCGDDSADGCGGVCTGLCASGQPGCTSNADCVQGNVCGIAVGAGFGLAASANVCWPAICAQQDPSKPSCGVGAAACGACPVCSPSCTAGSTGPDGCGGFCGACPNGQTRLDNGLCIDPKATLDSLTANFPIPLSFKATDPFGATEGKYAVTAQGTASYSIPIEVPPGRMGLQPSLSLEYLSTKTNGPMGLGWRLGGLSTISRCPGIEARHGTATPISFTEQDDFCIDGSALVLVASGGPGRGDEYRTEVDSFRRIMASEGGSFASDGTYVGPTSFTVQAKDGRVLEYGTSANARVYSGVVAWKWALSRVSDRFGNTIEITYDPHSTAGNSSLKFANYKQTFFALGSGGAPTLSDHPTETGELLPSTIAYNGGHATPPTAFVSFEYEDRSDPLQHYTAGAVGYSTKRLTHVKTQVGSSVIRDYQVNYEPNRADHESRVSSVAECAPESGVNVCKQPTTFAYNEADENVAPEIDKVLGRTFPGGLPLSMFAMDANGDGLDDAVGLGYGIQGGAVTVLLSAGAGSFTDGVRTEYPSNDVTPCISSSSVWDINNDGKDDLVYLCPNGPPGKATGEFPTPDPSALAYISNGDGSFTPQTLPLTFSGHLSLGDVDGDGRKDFIDCRPDGSVRITRTDERFGASNLPGLLPAVTIQLPANTGGLTSTGFSAGCSTLQLLDVDADGDDDLFVEAAGRIMVFDWSTQAWRDWGLAPRMDLAVMADINGDGLIDIVNGGGTTSIPVWINTGVGFVPTTVTITNPLTTPGVPGFLGFGINPTVAKAIDLDGDGRQEIGTHFGILRFTSLTSAEILSSHLPFEYEASTLLDANGDGEKEFISINYEDATLRFTPIATAARAGLMQSATDGIGRRVSFQYDASFALPSIVAGGVSGPATPTYTPGTPNEATLGVRKVSPLVSHMAETQVSATQQSKPGRDFFYNYDGARLGLGGRGWYGFADRKVYATDATVSTLTTLTFNNLDFYAIDLVDTSKVEWLGNASPSSVSSALNTRVQTDEFDRFSKNGDHQQFVYVASEVHTLQENGKTLVSKTVTREVDEYGNVTLESPATAVRGISVDAGSTARTYDIDASQWLISRVVTESTRDSRASHSATHATHYTYVPGTDTIATIERQTDPTTFSGPNPTRPTEYKSTVFTREGSGNVQKVCETDARGPKFARCTSVTSFDEQDLFPTGYTDPVGLQTQVRYRSIDGQVWWTKDPNGLVSEQFFDAFGRVNQIKTPTSESSLAYSIASPVIGLDIGTWSAFQVSDVRVGKGTLNREFDAFGRLVQTFETGSGPNSQLVTTEREYDSGGRIVRATAPHILGDRTQGVTQLSYDAFGRLSLARAADGTTTNYFPVSAITASGAATSLFATTSLGDVPVSGVFVQKPRQNVETLVRDFAGSPVRSLQAPNLSTGVPQGKPPSDVALTNYHYGPFGYPLEIDAPVGATTFVPDNLGRTQQLNDPALGVQTHIYDGFDEVTQQVAGNGTVTNVTYDADGRQTQLLDVNNSLIAKWIYDGDGSEPNQLGRIVSTYRQALPGSSTGNWTHYEYQSGDRGLLQAINYGIGGVPSDPSSGEIHTVGFEYKNSVPWQLDVLDYPNDAGAFRVGYDYDVSGNISKVYPASDSEHPYWQLLDTDQGIRPKSEAFGNGLVTTRDYYALNDGEADCVDPSFSCLPGRLRGITTQKADASAVQPIQLNSYRYDTNGNLSISKRDDTQTIDAFGYDGLDRLANRTRTLNGADAVPVESYSYDSIGNLLSSGSSTYEYNNLSRPFQVTRAGNVAYDQYDGAGNPIHRSGGSLPGGSQTFEYNDFNMPWRITSGTGDQVEFEYDGSGSRIVKRQLQGGVTSQETLDIAELYEQVSQFSGGVTSPSQQTHQYRIYANRQVAQVTRIGGSSTTDKTRYVHDDIVGSASAITDENGTLVEQRNFSSFGDDAGSVDYTNTGILSGFTGAEQDPDIGLTNMRGRLYDAKLGRFITPDPFVARPLVTQGLNRYAYVENNPLKFVDPSGFDQASYGTGIASNSGGSAQGLGLTIVAGSDAPSAEQGGSGGPQGADSGGGGGPPDGVGAGSAPGDTVGGDSGPSDGPAGATTGSAPSTTSDPTQQPGQGSNWTAGNSGTASPGSFPHAPGAGSPQAPGTSVADPWYGNIQFGTT